MLCFCDTVILSGDPFLEFEVWISRVNEIEHPSSLMPVLDQEQKSLLCNNTFPAVLFQVMPALDVRRASIVGRTSSNSLRILDSCAFILPT